MPCSKNPTYCQVGRTKVPEDNDQASGGCYGKTYIAPLRAEFSVANFLMTINTNPGQYIELYWNPSCSETESMPKGGWWQGFYYKNLGLSELNMEIRFKALETAGCITNKWEHELRWEMHFSNTVLFSDMCSTFAETCAECNHGGGDLYAQFSISAGSSPCNWAGTCLVYGDLA